MASLTVDQLKKINITTPTGRCGTTRCPVTISLYDALSSFFTSNSFIIYSDSTLSGNGTLVSPLKIAQQSATSGQVLTWNGTTWIPQSPSVVTQTLTLTDDEITLSGGGSIPVEDLISTDGGNQCVAGSDGLLFVPAASSLPSATVAGQIVYWTGLSYAVALEYVHNASPANGTTDVSLAHTPISSLPVKVFLNGVLQRNTLDYTISGNTITFLTTFQNSARVTTFYYN